MRPLPSCRLAAARRLGLVLTFVVFLPPLAQGLMLMPGGPRGAAPEEPVRGALSDEEGWPYGLRFDCAPRDVLDPLAPACPRRITAQEDRLGSPVVAVDPTNPEQVTIAALGGTPARGATPWSRGGASPIVLFSTEDRGATFARAALPVPAEGLLGEDVALVADGAGRLVLSGLYSRPEGGSALAAWKLGPFPGAPSDPALFASWTAEGAYARASLAFDRTSGLVGLVWEESGTAPDHREGSGPSRFVRAAWTTADPATPWMEPREADVLGPCGDVSNAVAWNGTFYVACVAEASSDVNETRWAAGDLVLYGLDPARGDFTFASRAPFPSAGEPTLAVTDTGRVAVAALVVETPERVRIFFTTGPEARNWSAPVDVGSQLHNASFAPVRDADILALAFRATSRTFHIVYREIPEDAPAGPTAAVEPRYRKFLAATTMRGALIFRHDLGVDHAEPRALRDPAGGSAREPFLEDPQDSLVTFETREFVAFADSGALVFGELAEAPFDSGPGGLPTAPSSIVTKLSVQPHRSFTLAFELAGALLTAGVLVRVLVGRIKITAPRTHEGETRP